MFRSASSELKTLSVKLVCDTERRERLPVNEVVLDLFIYQHERIVMLLAKWLCQVLDRCKKFSAC
jgi:hypothetical protein